MKLQFTNDRVLAVVAHPDDAELLCAGTLARAREDGAEIGICVLCQGDKGQPAEPIDDLAGMRREEMGQAASVLGAFLFRGEFGDGLLVDDPGTRRQVIELVRQFRPTLILAHDPGDYHPDHRAASQIGEAVSWFAASRGQKTDSEPLDAPPALWWMDTIGMTDFEPGFYLDVTDSVPIKEKMLACHKSQLQRKGDRDFAPLLDLMRSQMKSRGFQSGVAAAEAFRAHHAFKRARAW